MEKVVTLAGLQFRKLVGDEPLSEPAYKIQISIRRVTEQYVGALDRIGLLALKNKYDPANLFRLNQNIKPTV